MKLINLKCPNCNADVQVNKGLNTAVCNYCGTKFMIEDDNETEEERILKTKAKLDEKSKLDDREYYASDNYKKRVEIEKETAIERIFRKRKEYENSPEGKKELINSLKIFGILILIIIISILLGENSEHTIDCEMNNKQYYLIVKKKEKIQCASCSIDMINELNNTYLDLEHPYNTIKNIENYFVNNNGTCK